MTTTIHHNFVTHKDVWRKAIELAIENSPPRDYDQDDAGFWRHELKAFDEAYAQLETQDLILLP
ncbi:hypothetical protein [Xanthomonas phage X1]|nr:hypothetical protein [Xanthomonas phage X1]